MNQEIKIEIVYNADCWFISEFRKVLRKALLKSGIEVYWEEWKAADNSLPERLHSQAPLSFFAAEKLVLIADSTIPDEAELLALFQKKTSKPVHKSWLKQKIPKVNLPLFSAIGVVLIPKCPICWAAYMSMLSAFGFSSVEYKAWLLPLMLTILIISVGITLYQAFIRKRFIYMMLVLTGVTMILLGKLVFGVAPVMYIGIALIMVAYIRHQFIIRNFNFRTSLPQSLSKLFHFKSLNNFTD